MDTIDFLDLIDLSNRTNITRLTFEREDRPMRRRWLVRTVCIALLSLYSYPAAAQEARQGPKMVLKERKFDFNEVKEGEIIRHSFQVLNHGDETLKIIRVRPG